MKRLTIAIVALLAAGCRPAPRPNREVSDRSLRPLGAETSAFEAARGFLEADLAKRYGPGRDGYRVPDLVTQSNMLRDFQDPTRYEVSLPATAEGRPLRTFTVQMRQVGDDWRLLRVYEPNTADSGRSVLDTP